MRDSKIKTVNEIFTRRRSEKLATDVPAFTESDTGKINRVRKPKEMERERERERDRGINSVA